MATPLRTLTSEEQAVVRQLAHSRTAPARTVERAQIIWAASQGEPVPSIAKRMQRDPRMVALWIGRFNDGGVAGLEDKPRAGRPFTYTPEQIGEVIAAATTAPKSLGLPFTSWTLDRLQAYLNEERGIGIKRSRLDEILLAEGLRWRTHETWFGERADPDFAEKRGSSRSCIPSPRQTA